VGDNVKKNSFAFRVLVGIFCAVILLGALFVFLFVHQVQAQQKFRVTLTKFGAFPMPHGGDDSWRVIVEQLTYEELKNVEIRTGEGSHLGSGQPFYGEFLHNETFDGRAQKEWSQYPQPINITIVWDGGAESFVFNRYPFVAESPPQVRFPTEKLNITQASFDKTNPDNILVNVACLKAAGEDGTVHITDALVKNATGMLVNRVHLNETVLHVNETATIRIATPTSLPPGKYTVTIVTGYGGSYVSPEFTKP
jgi:hypothetical protein